MIQIIKEKPLKSTTKVEGILIQVTGGQWYGITRFQPARNPWFGRAGKSTSTGRIDFGRDEAVFMKKFMSNPTWDELKTMLVNVLNGEEPSQDKMSYL
jgi:hypothetical protein